MLLGFISRVAQWNVLPMTIALVVYFVLRVMYTVVWSSFEAISGFCLEAERETRLKFLAPFTEGEG